MALKIKKVTVPLVTLGNGTLRVRGTRIPLERIVFEFNVGSTPEQIADDFDTLQLPDIYAVIAFYLQNKDAVDEYVREREAEAERLRAKFQAIWPNDGIRERLLARRKHLADQPSDPPRG